MLQTLSIARPRSHGSARIHVAPLEAGNIHIPVQPDPGIRESPLSARLCTILETNAPLHRGIDPKLKRVISTVLANPGSLFRAELALLTAQSYGLAETVATTLACAVEYFHVASLLFDDMPFMDDAIIRRGQTCAHLLHGEGPTVLAALAFITRAYALAGKAIKAAPSARQEPALAMVERCLGTAGMINGQARDLHFDSSGGGSREVAMFKTVPLIELSLGLSARLGGASQVELRMLRRLSVCWGLFYQGIDDLKDVLESTDASGKSSNQDQRLSRPNVARQLGFQRVDRYLRRLESIARRCIAVLESSVSGMAFLQTYHGLLTTRLEQLLPLRP
jgi:geranylgeranyl diphosphate synthase type II